MHAWLESEDVTPSLANLFIVPLQAPSMRMQALQEKVMNASCQPFATK